ncbi:peptidoglycan DD-metalloendopeptidase family protein [Paenibacillus sp. GCM10027627]|uniref:peptidoglycan DD-metalloendopeptidase family protein n=1 Tax=unclassified Paenibacillus TaxID=185978 RepID=UPI00363FAE05
MNKKIAMILLLLLLMPSTLAAAEDASVLFKKYNLPAFDPLEEAIKLQILEEEYVEVSTKVNTNTMLEAAMVLHEDQRKNAFKRIDTDIYELTDELTAIEGQMGESHMQEVSYIMELDTRYRETMQKLDEKQQERKEWTDQQKEVGILSPDEAKKDRQKLESLSPKIEQQKQNYEKAVACPVLGDVTTFSSPLEIPVQLTSPYGERLDPITLDAVTFHHGMDMYAPEGTLVLSAFNGVVEEASTAEELGNYVIVDHGCGIKTLYGHLESYDVAAGDQVTQYQSIARSGNTGSRTTGPHLHFAVYINGKSVDPAVFVPY